MGRNAKKHGVDFIIGVGHIARPISKQYIKVFQKHEHKESFNDI